MEAIEDAVNWAPNSSFKLLTIETSLEHLSVEWWHPAASDSTNQANLTR